MILFPNAKINIGLDIVSKRPDGYHNIETVMYPVPWRDVLEIVPAKGSETTLTVTGREVNCPPEKNLVMKAYNALSSRIGLPPVDIYLRKIIPDGAGLGGGSADAAFTLVGLNQLFALGLSDRNLADVAAGLGADCPFFVYNRPMLCTGIGTEFTPVDLNLKGYGIVIVKPEVSVPTALAYSRVTPAEPTVRLADKISAPPTQWQGQVKNDFEASVFPAYPSVSKIKDCLIELGAVYAAMSGSGSAVYGIFESDILSERLTDRFPGCTVFSDRFE
ncbi:MAG: 4-(cytidine 5'-diphospho)-2-C-methyl-D-erythritol kinase [Muribaculaceae bacterium]|nr:4-(cytidine 5'-diphospho)-2-C-methyl-D-erythritol kinase [Muribaculaceae bacterium]